MAIISRNHLSGCTDGIPVALAVDSGTFTTIHTITTTTADFEEVWIWLSNISTATEVVTLTFGGTSAVNKCIVTVPPETTVLAVPGWTFQGVAGPKTITGGSVTADKINVFGYINLIDAG
tara:strand:- start:2179 stop:2538 length:360 start_codon:yes stop_codon:yes gene_type:complete